MGIGSFADSKLGNLDPPLVRKLSDWLKTDEETNKYFRCHLGTQQDRLQDFKSFKEPYLDIATQIFQVPPLLASCMMFKESTFNNKMVSSKEAATISQFTKETYDELIKQIRQARKRRPLYLKFQDLRSRGEALKLSPENNKNPFVRWQQYIHREGPYYKHAQANAKVKARRVAEKEQGLSTKKKDAFIKRMTNKILNKSRDNALAEVKNFKVHDALLQDLKKVAAYVSAQPEIRKTKPGQGFESSKFAQLFPNTDPKKYPSGDDLMPPSDFSNFKRNKMWISIFHSYFLKEIITDTENALQVNRFQKGGDPMLYPIIIAGAYNRGVTKFRQIQRAVDRNQYNQHHQRNQNKPDDQKGTLQQWCQELSHTKETMEYMLSIRRCMTRGVFTKPAGWKNTPPWCQKGEPPPTTDPCEPINPRYDAPPPTQETSDPVQR